MILPVRLRIVASLPGGASLGVASATQPRWACPMPFLVPELELYGVKHS